jgi:hypothetical protein
MIYDREKLDRIATFITITAEDAYIHDPDHRKSRSEAERELGGSNVHETENGWSSSQPKKEDGYDRAFRKYDESVNGVMDHYDTESKKLITRKSDLFDGKPEEVNIPEMRKDYVYDPEHKKSKSDVQRALGTNKPIHETPKGWAEGAEQTDMFKNAPTTSNENKDLFGNPVPSDKAVLPLPPNQEPLKPEIPALKPDLEGQTVMPIVEPPKQPDPAPSATEAPKGGQAPVDPDGFKKAVMSLRKQFNSPHVLSLLSSVPKGMLTSIGSNIKKFDTKGLDLEMTVTSPVGSQRSIVVKHDATPINEMDRNMQELHSVGSAWAVSSGLADNEEFQQQANKAWTKDMDNFVSRFTDLPVPGEDEKTISPANWIAKGYSNPRTKGAFYKMFARGLPDSGDKTALMVRSFLGAMQVASNGEYGYGTPQQQDNDLGNRVSNMAGYMAQGFANDSGFMKKNMPLTSKLFEDHMKK